MEHQRVAKPAQKELPKTLSSTLHQTSLNHVAVHPVLELQRTIGNQAVLNMLRSQHTHIDTSAQAFREPRFGHDFSRIPIHSSQTVMPQMKLKVSQPGDMYEQEADQVAEQVMRMTDLGSSVADDEHEAKTSLMRVQKAEPSADAVTDTPGVPPIVHDVLNSGGGQPLDTSTRAFMEPRFGHDFSKVRVHTDARAAESAGAVDALAYTVGWDVVFAETLGSLQADQGRRLLAHELTHVLQQNLTNLQKKSVSDPVDALEVEADCLADAVITGGQVGLVKGAAGSAVVLRKSSGKGRDMRAEKFPWIGRIRGTYSAALRKTPSKDRDDPHAGTLADLAEGEFVDVIGRKGGWLNVRATVGEKEMEGYVSQELVAFDRWDIDPEAMKTGLTMRKAFVVLKRAETHKKADAGYKPSEDEKTKIDAAIATVKEEPKYQVNEATFQVTFAKKGSSRIKITTIEDFVLFVEAVETQYPGASAKEVVSEIRQIWFSDENWELLVESEGIKESGKQVDIETLPNPIAAMFDMPDLAPEAEGKVIATPMGNTNIGHVLAGIDARLSGGPASYPKDRLKHPSGAAKFKYEKLQEFDLGDPTAFATFAGDLGQAFASFIFDRYEKGDDSAKLWMYITTLAKPAELIGDIQGYIAVAVAADMRASGSSPTGTTEVKASSIIRDMYLVDKSLTGATANDYLEKVAGKKGAELKQYIYSTSMSFAHLWYAKLIAYNSLEIGLPGDLFDDYVREFSERADRHESSAAPGDTLSGAIDDFLAEATGKLK